MEKVCGKCKKVCGKCKKVCRKCRYVCGKWKKVCRKCKYVCGKCRKVCGKWKRFARLITPVMWHHLLLNTPCLFSSFPSRRWKRNEKKLSLNFFYVLSTRTIYFTTFSNVSYKLGLDPPHRPDGNYTEQIRIQIFRWKLCCSLWSQIVRWCFDIQ